MKRRRVLLVVLLLLVWSAFTTGPVGAGLSATFDYHVADEFIESGPPPDQTGAVAEADNGHTISVVGSGKVNLGSKKASGGGTFVHLDENGDLFASGTWTAKTVEGFTFYGCGDGTDFPKNFCGGLLTLGVEALPHGGDPLSAVLAINCLIGPDASGEEGITLDAGVINFDDTIPSESGFTIFITKSKS